MSTPTTKPAASKAAHRSKGRPDATDSVGREALIKAAIEALRSTTPQSLTLAAVAAQADVHPALIRYYFGNKDGLLREVTHHLVQAGHEAVRSKLESDAPLDEKLAERLNSMISLVQANPHYHRLMLDKVYSKAGDSPGDSLLGQITSRGMRLTTAMLHDGETHTLRPVDPRFLHVALIGLAEFFVSAKPLLQELFGEDADMDELRRRYVSFLQTLILKGITLPEAEEPGEKTQKTGT